MNCLFLLLEIVTGLFRHCGRCLLWWLSFWRRFVLGLRWRSAFTFFLCSRSVYYASESNLRFTFCRILFRLSLWIGGFLSNDRCARAFPLIRVVYIGCDSTNRLLCCIVLLLLCLLYNHVGKLLSFIASVILTMIVSCNVMSSFTGDRRNEGQIILIACEDWRWLTIKVLAYAAVILAGASGVALTDVYWSILTVLLLLV